jgi:hypothetical protein
MKKRVTSPKKKQVSQIIKRAPKVNIQQAEMNIYKSSLLIQETECENIKVAVRIRPTLPREAKFKCGVWNIKEHKLEDLLSGTAYNFGINIKITLSRLYI